MNDVMLLIQGRSHGIWIVEGELPS